MTLIEYKEYQESVAAFIAGERISFLSTGTVDLLGGESEQDDAGESWFSWSSCPCCKRGLGGSREYLHARDENNEIAQYEICEDCVYYINYDRLDDTTMMEIREIL